tara:strand:+ start:42 stop:797 length:756 start_codon:yes stop_codon:yes gene_type:complete
MKIRMNTKTLSDALIDIQMKGKYHNGDSAKSSKVSDYAMLELDTETSNLTLYNADNTTVCCITIETLTSEQQDVGLVTIEIEKTLKYLKTFNDSVLIEIADYVKVSDGSSTASLPLVVSHPSTAMIARLQGYQIDEENPMFGSVEFETVITTNSDNLSDAVKRCDVINNARYHFNVDETFTMSSERSITDKVVTTVPTTEITGEPSTVEVTGQFDRFFPKNTEVKMFLKDESPVVWKSEDRVLIKAPYIAR